MEVCVVSTDKKAKIKDNQNKERRYGVEENKKRNPAGGKDVYVESKDKKVKCRTIKTRKQVRMKYKVQENTHKTFPVRGEIFSPLQARAGGPPRLLPGGKVTGAWR